MPSSLSLAPLIWSEATSSVQSAFSEERNSWEWGAHNRTKVRCHRECQEHSKPFHTVERQFTLFVIIHFPSKALHSISGVPSTACICLPPLSFLFCCTPVQCDQVPLIANHVHPRASQGQDHGKRSQNGTSLHLPFIIATYPSYHFCPYRL